MSKAWNQLGERLITIRSRCEVYGCESGLGMPRKATQGHHSLIGRDKNNAKVIDQEVNWMASCAECNVFYRTADSQPLEYVIDFQVGLHGFDAVWDYLMEVKEVKPYSVGEQIRIMERKKD